MFFDKSDDFKDELVKLQDASWRTPYYDRAKLRKYVKTVGAPSPNSFLYHGEWVEFHDLQDFMQLLLKTDFNVDLNTETRLSKSDLADEIERLEDKLDLMQSKKSVEVDDMIYHMRQIIRMMEFVVGKGFTTKESFTLKEQFNFVLSDYIQRDKIPTKDFLLYLSQYFDMLETGDEFAKAKFQEYITKITNLLNVYDKGS